MLEAEVLGLRQSLAEGKANRDALRKEMDDLRRDRDHWRKLAEQGGPKLAAAAQKTWFCGRASAGACVADPLGAPRTGGRRRSGEEQESE